MILKNVHICGGVHHESIGDLLIVNDKVVKIDSSNCNLVENGISIRFSEDVIAYPGLINSHDHLALNTHSIFKKRIYNDYVEWAEDDFDDQKEEITNIPFELRCKWGILKNIIHGFTTVLQHDKWSENLNSKLVDVHVKPRIIHSLQFDNRWKLKALLPSRNKKVIHLAEGTNQEMCEEPSELLRYDMFPKKTIVVHGISLKEKEAKRFGGLIWCPNSNIYLYGKTAKIKELKKSLPIMFGTDSTVSSDWDLWKHINQAKELGELSEVELYNSLTEVPCKVFGLNEKGKIEENKIADIVVSRKKENHLISSFLAQNSDDILLIIKSGEIILLDDSILEQVKSIISIEHFERIKIKQTTKFIKFPIKNLVNDIKKYYPSFKFEEYFILH